MQAKYFILVFLYIWVAPVYCQERNVTAVYPWPGPVTVPVDNLFAPVGPIRIELSNDSSIQRELRIGERVAVILDCSKVVERTRKFLNDSNLPLSMLGNITWYAHFYDRNGRLTGQEIVVTESIRGLIKYDIFGRYNEFLEADGSVVPSSERIGGTANYRCELCYNGSNASCNSSTVFLNVIGDPPVVIIGKPEDFRSIGQTQYQAVFGADYCVRRSMGQRGVNIFLFLTCSHNTSFPYNPLPFVSYTREGVPLTGMSSRYILHNTQSLIGRTNTLIIIADYTKDNEFNEVLGNYGCTMTNLYGNSSTTTTITECCEPTDYPNITNGSGFIERPSENTIRIGVDTCFRDNLMIQCMIDSDLSNETSIEWTKNGIKLDTDTSKLTINSTGVYSCNATNRCGTNTISSTVSGNPIIDSGSGLIISDTIKVGQNACLAHGANLDILCRSSSPQVKLSWALTSNLSNTLGSNQTLTVNETGTYRCTATNPCGSNFAESTVRRLANTSLTGTITGTGSCDKLRIRPSNVDLCPFLGDSLSLLCTSSDSNVMRILTPPGLTNSLQIGSVNVTDGRTYTCNVTNDCGSSISRINVQVYDPARIDRLITLPSPGGPSTVILGAGRNGSNMSIEITTGNRVELHCPFTGIETPTTSWFRSNATNDLIPIDSSQPGLSLVQTTGSAILIISNYSSSFAGRYRCVTSNLAGFDTGDVVLRDERMEMTRWHTSEWTECSKTCGGGERIRAVTCVTISNSMTVGDSLCRASMKPHFFEFCNTDPCCEKDLHPSCKFLSGTDSSCTKQEYKDVCCCTCRS